MARELVIYPKDKTTVAFTGDDKNVAITGLEEGQVVADGDYQVAARDTDGKLAESDKVDVPGFTVPRTTETEPTDVKSTATSDGATVTGA